MTWFDIYLRMNPEWLRKTQQIRAIEIGCLSLACICLVALVGSIVLLAAMMR
jgi:hypothetical protein